MDILGTTLLYLNTGSYSGPKAKGRAGGHLFLLSNITEDQSDDKAVLNIQSFLKNMMLLVADTETGALFLNSR